MNGKNAKLGITVDGLISMRECGMKMHTRRPGVSRMIRSVAVKCLTAGIILLPSATFSRQFSSIDFEGFCHDKYPSAAGATTVIEEGVAYNLFTNSGDEIGWHCSEDQGRFVYTLVSGDFDITVQVYSATTQSARPCRAGLMARPPTLGHSDLFVQVGVNSNFTADSDEQSHGFVCRRVHAGCFYTNPPTVTFWNNPQQAQSVHKPGYEARRAPDRDFPNEWLRLKREGNVYYGWYGSDGVTWSTFRKGMYSTGDGTSFTVDLGDTLAVGMSLESRVRWANNISAAQFRNLSIITDDMPPTSVSSRMPAKGNEGVVRLSAHKEIAFSLPAGMWNSAVVYSCAGREHSRIPVREKTLVIPRSGIVPGAYMISLRGNQGKKVVFRAMLP